MRPFVPGFFPLASRPIRLQPVRRNRGPWELRDHGFPCPKGGQWVTLEASPEARQGQHSTLGTGHRRPEQGPRSPDTVPAERLPLGSPPEAAASLTTPRSHRSEFESCWASSAAPTRRAGRG